MIDFNNSLKSGKPKEFETGISFFAASRTNASKGFKNDKKFVEFGLGISKIEIVICFDFLVLKN